MLTSAEERNGSSGRPPARGTARLAKKLFIKTYGCQMNVYDSDRMAEIMAREGYDRTEDAAAADLILLNTCHIREKAAEKVYSELGRLKPLSTDAAARGRRVVIGVGGCVAQAEGPELAARAPVADLVFGPQTYHRLPDMVRHAEAGDRVLDVDLDTRPKFDALVRNRGTGAATAFLSVQEGCDKFCTFCVVPYTRGAEYSRPAAHIIEEARALVANGTVEITLLGQNVNAWHGAMPDGQGEATLGQLIHILADIDGLKRIRYTTSHPRDMDADLIAAHADVPQLMPYLHLPVQSGSDRMLAAMNRGYGSDDFRAIVERLRTVRPDVALSSDFIVGFPGETDADFEATMSLVREIGFAAAFSFKYSARPGTPAAAMAEQVPEAVKAERLAVLQAELSAQTRAFNASCVGRTLDVLFDRPGRHAVQAAGRSPYLQPVHVACGNQAEAEGLTGRVLKVRIDTVLPNSLAGTLVIPARADA